jgi:hypothetical protein
MLAELERIFDGDPCGAARALWLVDAVDVLANLLREPSALAGQARQLACSWTNPCVAPNPDVDGKAWIAAAASCAPEWSPAIERAWRQAWYLLADVLAAETLSPFGDVSTP